MTLKILLAPHASLPYGLAAAPSTSLAPAFSGLTKGDGFPGADAHGVTRRGPGTPAQPLGGGCEHNDS
jgi:hypothetical protein